MPSFVLTAASKVRCTHGATAIVVPNQTAARAAGSPMLTERDKHNVAACPFNVNGSPQPCVKIVWKRGSSKVRAGGNRVLTRSSIGQCKNASGAVQGTALVVSTQTKVRAG
jgi:hypothetical protein